MAAPLVTIPEMAHALRITADMEAVESTIVTILARTMVAGIDLLARYAPDAPEPISSEALIRFCAYLYDAPTWSRTPQNAFANSGCQALLSFWHVPQGAAA